MSSISATDATFVEEVHSSSIPVVVDFWAPWCGPCKQITPALEEIAAEMSGKMKIVTVNIDENTEFAAKLGVRSIPALFLFKDGAPVTNASGAKSKSALKAWIDASI